MVGLKRRKSTIGKHIGAHSKNPDWNRREGGKAKSKKGLIKIWGYKGSL